MAHDSTTISIKRTDDVERTAVSKLRRIFLGSIILCVLVVLHLLFLTRQTASTQLRATLLCVLLWSLVVTCYAFHAMGEIIRESRRRLRELRERDSITGAYTETYLRQQFEKAAALTRETGAVNALGYVQLSGIQDLNHDFGYTVGNIVLYDLTAIMMEAVPNSGIVCRLGGMEFSVLMPETALAEAQEALEGLRQKVRAYTLDLGERGCVGKLEARAGAVSFCDDSKPIEDVIREARHAAAEVSLDDITTIGT